jgi:hypothetical protein
VNPIETDLLSTVFARDLETERPQDRWLIESLWGRESVGVIGGSPKTMKSWLGLDFAVSVASGTPALDHFPVEAPGTALIYLAEDGLPQVRSRLEAICRHRGIPLENLHVAVITEPTVRLDAHRDQLRLRATIAHLRPRLLVLDPLVRLHSLDENSSQDISRLLGYLRDLQRSFDLALILVHHTSKRSHAQPGQSLRGSSDLHAFGDSNAYLARRGEEVLLTLEHRSARAPEPMVLRLACLPDGAASHLELQNAVSADVAKVPLERKLVDLLRRRGPLPRIQLRSELRINNHRLGEVLTSLEKAGEIQRTQDGWGVHSQKNGRQPS